MGKGNKGQVKIIGGQWRGRWIDFQGPEELRPTPNRVRETLFNWLGQTLTGQVCLDLFAGSGALGIEALSRGAREVIFVEFNRFTANQLQVNLNNLRSENGRVFTADSWQWIERDKGVYDVIFLDPPFFKSDYLDLLERVRGKVAERGVVYCESPRGMEFGVNWRIIKQAQAGQVQYQLLQPIQDLT